MTVHIVTLSCASAAQAERVADALEPLADAVSWFEKEDGAAIWIVSAYFDGKPDPVVLKDTVSAATDDTDLAAGMVVKPLPDQDWVAQSQRMLPPVHAGGFVIHGSHDRETVPQDENAIEIEAGAAFGTAHHGTTTGCLEAITQLHHSDAGERYSNILDLGTGSAVLAIAAERRWPEARILATDIDPIAIIVAEGNASLNRARNIEFSVADGLDDSAIAERAPFDLLIANILAGPLIALAPGICETVTRAAHGRIVLSGLLDDQADEVTAAYAACGYGVETRLSREGWATLTLRRA